MPDPTPDLQRETRDAETVQDVTLADLTAKQCECLELVLAHRTSKQIALDLGISPYTVDQRLDSARRKLGMATRQDAAMAYARLKAQNIAPQAIPERLVYQPEPLAPPPESAITNGETTQGAAPPDDLETVSPLWFLKGSGPVPTGVMPRLIAIFVLAGLLMALGLIGIAAASGITYLLRHL
jgi:DNA-binding CsgD family transcriptional regulator